MFGPELNQKAKKLFVKACSDYSDSVDFFLISHNALH